MVTGIIGYTLNSKNSFLEHIQEGQEYTVEGIGVEWDCVVVEGGLDIFTRWVGQVLMSSEC
jgi:hypothetical protein